MSDDSSIPDDVEEKEYEFTLKNRVEGNRIDSYLATRFPDYSRTFIQKLIDCDKITVNDRPIKASYEPKGGDRVTCRVPVVQKEKIPPENIPLDIIYEDRWLVVVNKAADLVVHPSRGHTGGTLVNALAYHCDSLSEGSGPLRPGIVHRLDRDTTGAIVVAKDDSVQKELQRQFHDREVKKEYIAVCEGHIELDSDVVDEPLGSHRRHKKKQTVRPDNGKRARTVYEVAERVGDVTIVRCFPETGRTHQIRVHLRHIGHPVVADQLYGRRKEVYRSDLTGGEHHPAEEPVLERQALHARRLTLYHPERDEEMTFEADIPEDMWTFIELVRSTAEADGSR
jgi:23S rRNA pseudouridine1911/1915/1917 synthase